MASNIHRTKTDSKNKQDLLDITTDSHLFFAITMNKICKKGRKRLNFISHIASYMDILKHRLKMKLLQLLNFSLFQLYLSRAVKSRINSKKERPSIKVCAVRKENSVSIQHRKLQAKFLSKIFKVFNSLLPNLKYLTQRTCPQKLHTSP